MSIENNFSSMNVCEKTPKEVLNKLANEKGIDILSEEFAKELDKNDNLKEFRNKFSYPRIGNLRHYDPSIGNPDDECIYFCGNSLGLKPKMTDEHVQQQLDKWAKLGVYVHFQGVLPAATCDMYGREAMGTLVGASPENVSLMNGLSVNLNLLLISFYQPTSERFKILIEHHAFPSDRYALHAQAMIRGYDPSEAVLEVNPREGEYLIRTEDIIQLLEKEGSSISCVCLSTVQYYTGQKFDMEAITKKGHEMGCYVGWDLAHAVGNVGIELDKLEIDFACWCTYKYLNSGAGCLAGAYVNPRHKDRCKSVPNLRGWWSNREETRFQMLEKCDIAEGVMGFKISNPSPIMVACVMASLEIFEEAGMDRILEKQFLLTGYLELLMQYYFGEDKKKKATATIITPKDPKDRGCQLSLVFSINLKNVYEEVQRRGIVCDIRLPSVLRIAPCPLYNTFSEVFKFVLILSDILNEEHTQD